MAGKLLKLLVKHKKSGKQYMRYFKTKKGFDAAKGVGGKAVTATGKHKLVTGEAFASMTKGEIRRELGRTKRMLIQAEKKVADAFLKKDPQLVTRLRTNTQTLSARVKSLNEAAYKKALQRRPTPKRTAVPRKKESRYGFVSVPKPNIRRSLR